MEIHSQDRSQRIHHDWYSKCFNHDHTNQPVPSEFTDSIVHARQRPLNEYVKETNGIEVSVTPFFLGEVPPQPLEHRQGSSPASFDSGEFMSSFVWQYRVKITNKNDESFRLLTRRWNVHSNNSTD